MMIETPEQILCDAEKSIIELKFLCEKAKMKSDLYSEDINVVEISNIAIQSISKMKDQIKKMRNSLTEIDHKMSTMHEMISVEVCKGIYPQHIKN